MADANQEIIKLWLETNLAEASKQGEEALKALRDQVTAMGPEVAEAFDKMAGAEQKVTEATVEVVQEQGKLKQQTMEFTEVLELHGQTERDLSTLSQEMLRRMQERQDAQAGVNRAVEMATEDLRAQAEAEEALGAVVAKNQTILDTAGTNFSKLSGNILKAERAGQALVTGKGLGRVGPMLESVTLAVGGPAGLGLALGAAAFALEGMLPKIIAWAEHWEKGGKSVDQVTLALNNLDKAQEISDRERAVKRADRQITKLEDKEDEQGFLSEADREKLGQLQATVFNTKRKIAEEKLVAGAGQSKKTREAGSAVKESLAESGGGEAAAKLLADRDGISIDEAYSVVASAMEGSGADIGRLQKHLPEFSEHFDKIGPEGKAAEKAAKEEEKARKKEEAEIKHLASERYAEEQRKEREQKAEIKHGAEQRYAEEQRIEREQEAAEKKAAAERARESSQRYAFEQKKERDEAREQAKAAKEHTPEALYKHQQHAQQNAIMGQVSAVNEANVSQGGRPATPEFMHHVARQAAANVTMGADLASAVQIAIAQVTQKIGEDFRRNMARQHQASQSFYAP